MAIPFIRSWIHISGQDLEFSSLADAFGQVGVRTAKSGDLIHPKGPRRHKEDHWRIALTEGPSWSIEDAVGLAWQVLRDRPEIHALADQHPDWNLELEFHIEINGEFPEISIPQEPLQAFSKVGLSIDVDLTH